MVASVQNILETILRLPETDRAEIAQRVIESLPDDYDLMPLIRPDIESAWRSEIRRRANELADGTAETSPGPDVLREVRERLQQ